MGILRAKNTRRPQSSKIAGGMKSVTNCILVKLRTALLGFDVLRGYFYSSVPAQNPGL